MGQEILWAAQLPANLQFEKRTTVTMTVTRHRGTRQCRQPSTYGPAGNAAAHTAPRLFFTHISHFAKTKAVIPRRTILECRTETAVLQRPRQRCALTPGAEGSAQTEAAGPTGHRRAHVNAGPYVCFGCNSEPGPLQNNIPTWEEAAH